jgi:hypothetical protein
MIEQEERARAAAIQPVLEVIDHRPRRRFSSRGGARSRP